MKHHGRLNRTIKYVLFFCIFIIVVNVIIGFIVQSRSKAALGTMTERNMQSITKAAADLMDGDALAKMQKSDVGSKSYNDMYTDLTAFQSNVDIEYIYVVRKESEDKYVFIIDPDPEEPADFGEEIVLTDALELAEQGNTTIDNTTVADRWGSYCSAYSPVFDSRGNVAAIVGVDFNTAWYQSQITSNTIFIIILTLAEAIICGFIVFLLMRRTRKRIMEIDDELNDLSVNISELTDIVTSNQGYQRTMAKKNEEDAKTPVIIDGDEYDEIGVLDTKIRGMIGGMHDYLDYIHGQTYHDALTNVGNTTAYHEVISLEESKIADKEADFALVIFDLNSLKQINDDYGHACGDEIIQAAAMAISDVFGEEATYRIGGDEFLVVAEQMKEPELSEKIKSFEEAVAAYNASDRPCSVDLTVAVGGAVYDPAVDDSYRSVFLRADEIMYQNKKEYYETHEDRRRH